MKKYVVVDKGPERYEISSFSITGKTLWINRQNGTLDALTEALGENTLRTIDLYITDAEIDGIDTTGIKPAHSITAITESRHIDANTSVYIDNIGLRIIQ